MTHTINFYIICKYGEKWYASNFYAFTRYFSTLTVIRNV